MKIFIGSSSNHIYGDSKNITYNSDSETKEDIVAETDSIAFKLSKKINDETEHIVLPWWKESTISQENFLNKIIELSITCDFGIFILDNEADNENGDKPITNSNVLIELGMFASRKGIDNIFLIVEDSMNVPSDFVLLNVPKYSFSKSNVDNTVNEIFNHVSEKINKSIIGKVTDYNSVNVYFSMDTFNITVYKPHEARRSNGKNLYFGLEAAKAWIEIESDPDYLPSSFDTLFSDFIRMNNKHLKDINNLVSLGSGAGTIDEIVCRAIAFSNNIKYIPVDINPYLVVEAIDRVKKTTKSIIEAYAIIDDFELRVSPLQEFILKKTARVSEKTLYTILGATFCNLDQPETFLHNWSRGIGINDIFILDVIIQNDEYDIKSDEKARIGAKYIYPLINNAIEQKYKTSAHFAQDKNAKEYIETYIGKRYEKDGVYDKFVKINTYNLKQNECVVFSWWFKMAKDSDLISKSNILFEMRRYNKKYIVEKIEKYFEIITDKNDEKSYDIEINDNISKAHFVLKKKTTASNQEKQN